MGIRRNAARLSPSEKRRFVDAVVTLKNTIRPGRTLSIYDEFVAIHVASTTLVGAAPGVDISLGATGNNAHRGSGFLPWHREFLRRFERELEAVDPSVSIPYFNWGFGDGRRPSDPWEIDSIFTDDFMGPGGSGAAGPGGARVVTTGFMAPTPTPLNSAGWRVVPELSMHAFPGVPMDELMARDHAYGTSLVRNPNLTNSNLPAVTAFSNLRTILSNNSYNIFREALESQPHDEIHWRFIGGNMSQMTSPEDPIFWLHHAQVDRLWAIWQSSYGHNQRSDYQVHSLSPGRPPSDLIGHRLTDRIWPWDGGRSLPHAAIRPLLPSFPAADIRTVEMVLDTRNLGYSYDPSEIPPRPREGH